MIRDRLHFGVGAGRKLIGPCPIGDNLLCRFLAEFGPALDGRIRLAGTLQFINQRRDVDSLFRQAVGNDNGFRARPR